MEKHSDNKGSIEKLNELIKDVKFCMLVTQNEQGEFHSRPMATQEVDENGVMWFFTGKSSHKVQEIGREHQVNVAYGDSSTHKYVSVSGTAELVKDPAKEKELWNPFYEAWFPGGLEDPDLALLKVQISQAEYWDVPGKVATLLAFAKQKLTGSRGEIGDHGKLEVA